MPTEPKEVDNALAVSFVNKSSDANYLRSFHEFKEIQELEEINLDGGNQEPYNDPLTIVELQESLQHFNKNSFPGPNDIAAIFMRHLPLDAIKALLQIYNRV